MIFRCFDLSDLPILKDIKVLAGADGMSKKIKRVNLIETQLLLSSRYDWIESGDLIIVTSAVFQIKQDFLEDFLSDYKSSLIAGLIFYDDEYITDEAVSIANKNAIPILKVDYTVFISNMIFEITQRILYGGNDSDICYDILDNIMYGVSQNSEMLVLRAKFYRYDLQGPHFSFVMKFETRRKNNVNYQISDVINYSKSFLVNHIDKALFTVCDNGFITLLPKGTDPLVAETLAKELCGRFPKLIYYGGIGNTYNDIDGFRRSINEARNIVKILGNLSGGENTIRGFHYMFIYMMIYQLKHEANVKQFYKDTLSGIFSYDVSNNQNLLQTLRVYLEENQNSNIAAQKLFIHRNTLKARIDKIEELTNKSLDCLEDRFDLCLALYIDDIFRYDYSVGEGQREDNSN